MVSTSQPAQILNSSSIQLVLYLLNIDDLDKTMDGIEFAVQIRENDLYGSIVFLTEYNILPSLDSDFVIRSLRSYVAAMYFLGKDSAEYEKELKECIAAHIRKISKL